MVKHKTKMKKHSILYKNKFFISYHAMPCHIILYYIYSIIENIKKYCICIFFCILKITFYLILLLLLLLLRNLDHCLMILSISLLLLLLNLFRILEIYLVGLLLTLLARLVLMMNILWICCLCISTRICLPIDSCRSILVSILLQFWNDSLFILLIFIQVLG